MTALRFSASVHASQLEALACACGTADPSALGPGDRQALLFKFLQQHTLCPAVVRVQRPALLYPVHNVVSVVQAIASIHVSAGI